MKTEQETARATSRRAIPGAPDAWLCAVASLVLYWVFRFDGLPPVGDAGDYASLIAHGELGIRTPHIGYYLFAQPFVRLGNALGASTAESLSALAALCMASTIGLAQVFYRGLALDRAAAIRASLVLATTGIFWYHAEFGELQALLMLLVIASLVAYWHERPILAAALCALALLTSQAAATIGLCFPLLAYWRRSWPLLIRFSLAFAVFFAAGVAPIAEDYFFGPRGLFPSMDYYQPAPFWKLILYFGYRLIENQALWLPFALVALLSRSDLEGRSDLHEPSALRGRLLALTLALFVPHAWVNTKLGHIEYGFAWMPFFFVTSAWAALGVEQAATRLGLAAKTRNAAFAALLLAFVLWTYPTYLKPKADDARALVALIRETAQSTLVGTLVASPYVGFVYVHETTPSVADVWDANWIMWPIAGEDWRQIVETRTPLYILTSKSHTHVLRRWLLGNPLAVRQLGEARADQFRLEGGSPTIEDVRGFLPPGFEIELVAQQGNSALYRVESASGSSRSRPSTQE